MPARSDFNGSGRLRRFPAKALQQVHREQRLTLCAALKFFAVSPRQGSLPPKQRRTGVILVCALTLGLLLKLMPSYMFGLRPCSRGWLF